ncbi:FxLYD domain-containing protein [Flavobacterium sp.]|uniref:FxLYD domain-containing protein n=1 Tax=Flavobacterium sp. TaxID=239 RepID=UPI00286C8E7A|nr:FxLYD domain-containing protein [Flavobacterium sp.]
MELQNQNSWCEKTWLVILLLIIFFPIGLYALWKNSSISKGWKIAVTCFFAVLVIANLGDKKNSASNTKSETTAVPTEEEARVVEETKPDVEILKQSSSYEDVMDVYTIHCRVRNNTDELINYVDLQATFYDKQGNIVGTGIGNAANFAAGAEKTIDVMGLDIQNCETYEVQVNNVMK